MNTHIKSALDKVKADSRLVEETEKYLRGALENQQKEKLLAFEKKSDRKMKKVLLAASVAAVFVIGAIAGGLRYLATPVAYISFDINPSVELGVNILNKVVTAEGVNRDGQTILQGQNIINRDLSEALDRLVDSAAQKKFIKDDGTTVISVTAESNNERKAAKLKDIGEQAVNRSINRKKFDAVVYKDCSDLALRTEAKKLGISPGKLKLIKSLQVLDPTITVDSLKDLKVSDIMLKAKELIDKLDAADDSTVDERIKVTAERLKGAAKKTEERVKNSVEARTEAAKEKAKAAFEAAKEQAKTIEGEAKKRAEELREKAKVILKNTDKMTNSEKEAVKAQAEKFRKQAEEIIKNAERTAGELKNTAEKQKDMAIEAAERQKNTEQPDGDKKDASGGDGSGSNVKSGNSDAVSNNTTGTTGKSDAGGGNNNTAGLAGIKK